MKRIILFLFALFLTINVYAADSKLTDLAADTSPTNDDLIYVVDDPTGTPLEHKVTIDNLVGTAVTSLESTTLEVGAGSAATAAIHMNNDTDSGVYQSAANEVAITCTGAGQVKITDGTLEPITDNDIDLGTSSAEFQDLYIDGVIYADEIQLNDSQRVYFGTGQDLYIEHDSLNSYIVNTTGVLYINAKSGETGVSLTADGETSLYYDNAARLTTVNAGVQLVVAGSANAPGLYFDSDPDTGFYRSAANQIAIAIGGAEGYKFTATGPIFTDAIKSDTGDPSGSEGQLTINTYDNATKIYAGGAWRTLATW